MNRFDVFWDRLTKHIAEYVYPYEVLDTYHNMTTAFADSRHGKTVLNRNGRQIQFHVYAISMMQ